ncbi:hypothetical protein [Sphingobacterium lactis]|uniref:LTXXQ motif family protein n=1 Tax=Sphingobacterium lactis TaxID=797291 RepID=A0A1H5ZSL6_9SPHI|nr:hypothetical protein [Sphingobacterium lactis]SEG39172.1 hypothetical protein SAMN05421877_107158 [Sphingobacterium lactis]
MKKLFLAVTAVLFSLSLTFAQEVNPEEKAKATVTEWTSQLNLTEDQQTQIYNVVLEHKKAKLALKADTTVADDAKATQIDALSADLDKKVSDLLTDEQKPLYAKIVEARAAKKAETPAAPPVQ